MEVTTTLTFRERFSFLPSILRNGLGGFDYGDDVLPVVLNAEMFQIGVALYRSIRGMVQRKVAGVHMGPGQGIPGAFFPKIGLQDLLAICWTQLIQQIDRVPRQIHSGHDYSLDD